MCGSSPLPDAVTRSTGTIASAVESAARRASIRARARGRDAEDVRRLVREHTDGRWLQLIGEPAVNVLELNLALDALTP